MIRRLAAPALLALAFLFAPALAHAQTTTLNVGTLNPLTANGTITITGTVALVNGVPAPLSGVNGAAATNAEHCELVKYFVDGGEVQAADAGFVTPFASAIDDVVFSSIGNDGGCALAAGTQPNVSLSGASFTLAANGTCTISALVCGH